RSLAAEEVVEVDAALEEGVGRDQVVRSGLALVIERPGGVDRPVVRHCAGLVIHRRTGADLTARKLVQGAVGVAAAANPLIEVYRGRGATVGEVGLAEHVRR